MNVAKKQPAPTPARKPAPLMTFADAHAKAVTALAFAPDGRTLVVAEVKTLSSNRMHPFERVDATKRRVLRVTLQPKRLAFLFQLLDFFVILATELLMDLFDLLVAFPDVPQQFQTLSI